MIVETTQKMETLTANDVTHLPVEVLLDIARAETEAYASGAFTGGLTEQFADIRSFYERLVVLLTKAGEFSDAERKFALLHRLYQLPYSRNRPSMYEAKITSLHLFFLYTAKDKEPYYAELASLEPTIASSADVKAIIEFEQLVDLGNYQRAFDLIQTLSPSHRALLGRLKEQRRYQNCKMIEYTHPHITVSELWKILEIKDTNDLHETLNFIEELYDVK